MKIKDKSHEELKIEVEKLRAQLAEAEETLRAIRRGEVDALVISGEKGEQVFTLKGAEQPYRILIEEMREGAAMLSADDTILYCNSGFASILKTPLEKLIGTGIAHYIAPADEVVFLERQGRERSSRGEITLLAADGTFVSTLLSLNTLQMDDAQFVYLVATDLTEQKRIQDELSRSREELEIRVEERTAELVKTNAALQVEINERKRAEEALRKVHGELELRVQERTAELQGANKALQKSEELFRISVENMLDAFGIYSAIREPSGRIIDFKIEYINTAACEGNLMTREEQIGKRLLELLPVHRESGLFDEYCLVVETGKPLIKESLVYEDFFGGGRFLRKAVDVQGMKLGDGFVATWRDVTKRKKAEEKIREQATLLDKAHDAIGLRNLEQNLIYWNKGAEYLYGWTADEVIGKNADELLYKGKTSNLIEAEKNVIEKGEWTGELHQVTKVGKEIIVESRWTLIYDSEGKPKSILIINTDITEKKKFEAQLLQAQRMESIGTLASGIAHDLNNVLTPMMLSLQLLKEKFKDEQSQKLLTILEKNSQRGADLIKQVLLFARGVGGERNPLQAKHIIIEIEKVAKETFPRNIEIITDIQKDLFTVSGDSTQLHQVLMNLCVNARDAMPDGGILSISAENFFIDETYVKMHTEVKVGPYIALAVSDTGIGIHPKIVDRIFEPFFTTKEFGKGTGLGLSTTLAIVKSHGGFINVYSEVGEGTTFRVYLPAIKTELQNVKEEQLELPIGQGELVLVAEDENSIREVTVATLEAYRYKVLTANDGADAVALYAQNKDKIKVILMDMMMPVMDGHASIRAIRKINHGVKIIAVSGLAEKDKLKNIADYTNAFLPKPYTAERLLKTIREVIATE